MSVFCFVSVLCLTVFSCFKLNQIVKNQTGTDLNSDGLFEALAHRVRKTCTKPKLENQYEWIEMTPFINVPIVSSNDSASIQVDMEKNKKKKKVFLPNRDLEG